METLFEYYLPGLNHSKMSFQQMAQKLAHLAFIRQQERTPPKTQTP